MSKKENAEANKIDALYAARKQRHLAPLGDKKSIIENASNPIRTGIWHQLIAALHAHAKNSAVFAAIAIAVVIIGFQTISYSPFQPNGNSSENPASSPYSVSNYTNPESKIVYTNVQVHSLKTENEDATAINNAERETGQNIEQEKSTGAYTTHARFLYTKAKIQMQKQQSIILANRELLKVVNQDAALQLVNCQNELIEVSKEALAYLANQQVNAEPGSAASQSINFNEGQLLAVSFDTNGYIINIGVSGEVKQCS